MADTFIRSIEIGTGDTFLVIFWQYSIPIHLAPCDAITLL